MTPTIATVSRANPDAAHDSGMWLPFHYQKVATVVAATELGSATGEGTTRLCELHETSVCSYATERTVVLCSCCCDDRMPINMLE
jgi:hypothetical protein